jgi:YhcH/YjgK/YiaL family protein
VVVDTLSHRARYARMHPLFIRAFEFLWSTDLGELPAGRMLIDGDRLYVSVDHGEGRGRDGARLEIHRKYIDIQVAIAGVEEIGWRPLSACADPAGPFTLDRDIGFFNDRPDTWIALPPGHFAIFFPEDAHAPLAGRGPLKKAIVKVLL